VLVLKRKEMEKKIERRRRESERGKDRSVSVVGVCE